MYESLQLLPLWYQYSVIFILGTILGSFLDVFTTRFHTGMSIRGRSHCCSCGEVLQWYELLPLVSYLSLRGRCRYCGVRIPVRLLLMELVLGGLFVLAYLHASSTLELAVTLMLLCVLVVIAQYDLRHMIIPDALVLTTMGLALVLLWPAAPLVSASWVLLLPSLVAAVVAFGFYAGLWYVSSGRWIGFGDAKLAFPLAFILGLPALFSFIVFSFWLGALISLSVIGVQTLLARGQKHLPFRSLPRTMKREVPFAPFMILSFLLVYFYGANVLALMSQWFYGSFF